MKSCTNWLALTREHVANVPDLADGVYFIRRKRNISQEDSDIIYIGKAGGGRQGVGKRLRFLLQGMEMNDVEKSPKRHSASLKILRYIDDGLEFSWIECNQAPDGVEKAFLLAFWTSMGNLPVCNSQF